MDPMVWDLICFRKSSEFQALDSFAKKLRAPEPTGFPRLKAVSPEVEAGIIWRRNLQIKSVPLRHILWDSVRLDTLTDFCQDDPRWSKMIKMIKMFSAPVYPSAMDLFVAPFVPD